MRSRLHAIEADMTRLALDAIIGAASPSLLAGRGIEALAAYRAALGS